MSTEPAYAPLASQEETEPQAHVEYEPDQKPQQAPQVPQQPEQPPVFWVPVMMPRRNKWRGSCWQCCGSSKSDCKACCLATCFPCIAFG